MSNNSPKMKNSVGNNWPSFFPFLVCLLGGFLLLVYSKQIPPINAILHNLLNFREAAAWEQLGDFIGGILNSFISLLTLIIALMVWTLQKDELGLTRDLLKKSNDTADKNAATATKQLYDQRFFDLLNLYQKNVDALSFELDGSRFYGKIAIGIWLKESSLHDNLLKYVEENSRPSYVSPNPILDQSMLRETWVSLDVSNFINPYFRIIYRILKDANDLLGDDDVRYIKILRAQLNRNELILLAYNMWFSDEGQRILPLAKKYGLLKHLPNGQLKDAVKNVFGSDIFGKSKEM